VKKGEVPPAFFWLSLTFVGCVGELSDASGGARLIGRISARSEGCSDCCKIWAMGRLLGVDESGGGSPDDGWSGVETFVMALTTLFPGLARKVKEITVPSSTAEFNLMLPPSCSTMFRVIKSPRPVPCSLPALSDGRREKALNRRSCWFAGMPGPLSDTEIQNMPGEVVRRKFTETLLVLPV
jgi:hypothetical protein